MNVKVLGFALAGVVTLSASAQDINSTYAPTEPAKNVSFIKNKASDNWFLQLQGGVNQIYQFGRYAERPTFTDGLGYSAGLGLGKWHNPYFGTRLMLDWNYLVDASGEREGQDYVKLHNFNPHFDFMFDMMNYFGVYNANRVFSIKPFLGVGYSFTEINAGSKKAREEYNKNWTFNHCVTGNAGISFDFRLAKRASLNIAPTVSIGNFLGDVSNMDKRPNDILVELKGGLTFDLGSRVSFDAVEPMDYALINDLNGQINKLRQENAELSKRPVRCPDCPEVTQAVVNNILDNVVYFRLNSARVDRNQLLNVYNTAEFVKANKTPIKVVGYADEKTGTSNYNMSLSEKRAKAVARLLVEKYGVPSELITIDWKGSSEQPYSTNAWNRVVIMKANN